MSYQFAEIILPLAVGHTFTYSIPPEMLESVIVGIRVEVSFGRRKHYAGIVHSLHNNKPQKQRSKEIIAILDEFPVIYPKQIKFWKWLSDYYMCFLGEIMAVALPPAMRLSSETRVIASGRFLMMEDKDLDYQLFSLRELLMIKEEVGIRDIEELLELKSATKYVKDLVQMDYLIVFEALDPLVTEKKKEIILLNTKYLASESLQMELFQELSRSTHQTNALMGILFLAKQHEYVMWEELKNRFDIPRHALKMMQKKGVLRLEKIGLSDIMKNDITPELTDLSEQQQKASDIMDQEEDKHDVFLLHGVTGSGKTHFYAHKMMEVLEKDPKAQVLYLLPEIALTGLTLVRLQRLFGSDVLVYHSKLSPKDRMTCWHQVLKGQKMVIGPRSALFLPFQNLKLLVVDEEHDPSFVQRDRNPHYQGRDAAIMMALQQKAKVILGSATPSIETIYKAYNKKFGYLSLSERYGGSKLPEVVIVDLKKARESNAIQGHFSQELIDEINTVLAKKKQVLLFQNRRGHSPVYMCTTCDWKAVCTNCDVSLTYHKYYNRLVCHMCNYSYSAVEDCPSCGTHTIEKVGLGTERIEGEIKELFPEVNVARLDMDTGARKNAAQEILDDFQNNKTQILVGTQMIAKGLDFQHIGLVGIVMADALMYFPEYRATERAFQLMMQVAGRAGRRLERGKVLVQTMNVSHPIFHDLKNHDYLEFVKRELQEREKFNYPPFCRMINIQIRHKKPQVANDSAQKLGLQLKRTLAENVIGPAQPGIARIKNYYIQQLMIKMPLNAGVIKKIKALVLKEIQLIKKEKGWSGVRVDVHVDY